MFEKPRDTKKPKGIVSEELDYVTSILKRQLKEIRPEVIRKTESCWEIMSSEESAKQVTKIEMLKLNELLEYGELRMTLDSPIIIRYTPIEA